jgi:hypothetical protein
MPQSWVSQELRRFASTHVDSALKRLGFRRHGLLWNRRLDDYVQAIQLQRSQYELDDEALFYLHAGVHSSHVWRILHDTPAPDPIEATSEHVQIWERFTSGHAPLDSWTIVPSTDLRHLGARMTATLHARVQPWLDYLSTHDGMREYFLGRDALQAPHHTGPDPAYIVVEGLLGHPAEVRRLVDLSLRRAALRAADAVRRHQSTPPFDPRPQLRQILERLGLDPGMVDPPGDPDAEHAPSA